MANWSLPTITDLYTNVLTYLKGRLDDAVMMCDSASTTPTNLPVGAKRWNAANKNWEKWSGSAWSAMATTYGISVSGSAGSASAATFATHASATGSIPHCRSEYGLRILRGTFRTTVDGVAAPTLMLGAGWNVSLYNGHTSLNFPYSFTAYPTLICTTESGVRFRLDSVTSSSAGIYTLDDNGSDYNWPGGTVIHFIAIGPN